MRHLVEVALTSQVTTPELLMATIDERHRRGVQGILTFRRMVARMLDDEPYPESLLEVDVAAGFAEVNLVGLSRQYRPEWYDGIRGTVDWHDELGGDTIIEADGRGFRQVTQAHDNDRQRDRLAAAHGKFVVRIGSREFRRARMRVLLEVKEIVERRRRERRAA